LDRPASSAAFDWAMAALTVVLMGGVIQDGWAHAHGKVDQSFFTPWHAVLYASMAVNGLVLGGIALRNVLRLGYAPGRALPYGYSLALAGVVVFAIAGGLDLVWHTLFGIEVSISQLLSPTHLLLALGAVLVFTGPLRSTASQYGRDASGWRSIGPALAALLAVLTMLGFFTAYAQPIEDGFTSVTIQPDANGPAVAALYASAPDGGTAERLAVPEHLDAWGITVAPGGRRIAYRAQAPQPGTASAQPPSDLYVANADGSHAVRITHSGRHDTQPAWSPDGAWIAYVSLPAGTSGTFSLRIVRPDGRDERTLIDGVTTLEAPSWSPDGRHIAYASRNGVTGEVAIVDAGGGAARWLAATKDGAWPAWSGRRILFASADGTLRSVELDGSHARTLATGGASQPATSGDGTSIAYTRPASGGTQVFVADADGGHARNVSQLSGADAARPAWSPDGRVLYTVSGRPAPERSAVGLSLAEAANLLEAVLLAGVLLLAIKRWRVPFGAFTMVLTLFALAMATQTDAYLDATAGLVAGLAVDGAILVLRARASNGTWFYAIGFALPALFFAAYLLTTVLSGGGSAWPLEMALGSPLLAGIAGLLVAFAYEPPLPPGPTGA
jgi:hypothetical protein